MRHEVFDKSATGTIISLEATLVALGLNVIPQVEIERYKLAKVGEMPKATFLGSIADFFGFSAYEMSSFVERTLIGLGILSLACVGMSLIGLVVAASLLVLSNVDYIALTSLSFSVSVSCFVLTFYLLDSRHILRTKACWMRVSWRMHKHDYQVPDTISARADVAQAFCSLSVLELVQDDVLVDPILVASSPYTGEECYIGIWEGDKVIV